MNSPRARTGPVSKHLHQTVRRLLREHGVVVWYDAGNDFGRFFEALDEDDVRKLRFEGSYFRLRHQIRDHLDSVRTGEADLSTLLVYVPRSPLPAKMDLLLPAAKAGYAFQSSLAEVTRQALRDDVRPERLREWLEVDGLTLEKLDELATESSDLGPLAVMFGDAAPAAVGEELLTDDDAAERIVSRQHVAPLRELLAREFGVRLPEDLDDAEQLRESFAERVLLYEFLDDLDEVPEELESYSLPEDPAQRAACADLARKLRDSRAMADAYVEWAQSAQKRFSLAGIEYDPAKLGRRDTFAFEERLALEHVRSLAAEDRWEEAREWVKDRRDSFWAAHDEQRQGKWVVAELATALRLEAGQLLEELPEDAAPEDWVRWYASPSGPAPWRADQLARKLSAQQVSYREDEALEEVADAARSAAAELERVAAERFVEAVASAGGAIEDIPLQADVFADEVAPGLEGGRTVGLVLADGLRFEMARELSEMLEDSGEVGLGFAAGTPPTETRVGMGAIVPGAEDGLRLEDADDGSIMPVVSGDALSTLEDRRNRFRAVYGDRVRFLTLEECLIEDSGKLDRRVGEADLIVLLSQDVDEIGEQDRVHRAADFMGQMISDFQRSLRRLSNAGVQEFVVVADHGYLLREHMSDAMKLDRPGGDAVKVARRYVAGRDLGHGEHHVVLRAADFGLGGDLEFAFPRGINVFKASGGNLAYLHGGLSLQELVVPVLRYVPETARVSVSRPSVNLEVVGTKVTNRYFQVIVSFQADELFDQVRRFRLELAEDGESVGRAVSATHGYREAGQEVELAAGEESSVMLGIADDLEGSGTLEIRVVNAETGEAEKTEEVRYDLAF